jgi:hypothetical protein
MGTKIKNAVTRALPLALGNTFWQRYLASFQAPCCSNMAVSCLQYLVCSLVEDARAPSSTADLSICASQSTYTTELCHAAESQPLVE